MEDTIENRKKLRNYREFIALWLKTGFEWYKEDPETITGWKFGHDWNNDFYYKNNYDDNKKYNLGYKFGIISKQTVEGIQSTISAIILSEKLNDNDIKEICDWLLYNLTITVPSSIYIKNKFIGKMCYILYYQIREIELSLIK